MCGTELGAFAMVAAGAVVTRRCRARMSWSPAPAGARVGLWLRAVVARDAERPGDLRCGARRGARLIPITASAGDEEEELVLEVLRSGELAQGPMVERFERRVRGLTATTHAVAVNNGTTALVAAIERWTSARATR